MSSPTFLLSLFFLFSTTLLAQKAPMKWGKINKEDLAMTHFEADPSADALVLCDYGQISFDITGNGPVSRFRHHKRIKILKKSAFDLANIQVAFYSYKNIERLPVFKAQVFLPNGEKYEVKKKDIFLEEASKFQSVKKVAIPNIQEGAIIEYVYERTSEDLINLEEWYFQGAFPIRHSELRVTMPDGFNYVSLFQGEVQFSVNEKKSGSDNIRGDVIEVERSRYVVEHIPAMNREAFITTMDDYWAKIKFQLKNIEIPGVYYYTVTDTWQSLTKRLMESDAFGGQIRKKRNFKQASTALEPHLEGIDDPLIKLQAIYHFVINQMSWNGRRGLYASQKIDEAFEKKSGTAADINLALLALLREHNIPAQAVLLSTRDHGRVNMTFPFLDQFNYVVVYAKVGEQELLMDATSPIRPINYLRVQALSGVGLLLGEEKTNWINVVASKGSDVLFCQFKLHPEGILDGSIKCSSTGYNGIAERGKWWNDKEGSFWTKRLSNRYADAQIKKISFEGGKDIAKAFKTTVECTLPDAAMVTEDMIYLSPSVYSEFDENPLKMVDRKFPVDMPHPLKENYVLNLELPEGYVVEELPEQLKLSLPNKGGSFLYTISQQDNKIQVVSRVHLDQLHFKPAEYPVIKDFLDRVIEKKSEQIVLKKQT
ncbi:MAG: DUF3857 domain-containing protein [Bacteroidota bacterium]